MNRINSATSRTQTTEEQPTFPGRPRTLNETTRVERDFRPFSIIILWNIDGAFFNSKGITSHS